MTWSTAFIEALDTTPAAVLFKLARLEVYNEPGSSWSVGSVAGIATECRIAVDGVKLQGQSVNPRGPWSTTIGGFTVDLVGELDALQSITRGSVVALYVGFAGMALSAFERVAIGQVVNLTGIAPKFTLQLRDLFSSFKSRLTVAREGILFSGLSSTTLTADAAVADGTYTVADTTGFKRETGGMGLVLVTPASGTAYFRRWSASTATTFTIDTPATASVVGTTDIGAVAGDVITEVAYLYGHPLDIARKVLASRGSGLNGAYDTLPIRWGLGIDDALIDHADINAWQAIAAVLSGTYVWELAMTGKQDDALTWLSGHLASAGFVLCMRQGMITIRAAQSSLAATAYPDIVTIDDSDIESVESYEAFDSRFDVEYQGVEITTHSGATASSSVEVATLPQRENLAIDVSDKVFRDPTTNQGVIKAEMMVRLVEAATKVPERIVLRCVGRRLAQLTVLDAARLTTTRVQSRRDGAAGFYLRRCLIDEVSPDYARGGVRVGVLVFPETDDVFA